MTGRIRWAAASAAAVVLVTAAPAAADCAGGLERETLFGADAVLVGTVVDVRPDVARLQVEEIWKGPVTRPQIWVQTGETTPGVAGSADVTLTQGAHYVIGAGADYRTDVCRVFGFDQVERLALRPATVTRPDAAGNAGADVSAGTPVTPVVMQAGRHRSLPILAGLVVALLLFAGLVRTSRRGWRTMGA